MIDKYVIYFFVLSFLGYLYECFVMTLWIGKWDNRGFLYGPIIPIYGTGALLGTILFNHMEYSPLSVFLIAMFASAILEYVVHYTMEKLFHAYWWDYSKAPLNINGRICLPASIGFGVAGLIIIYVINPFLIPLIESLNENVCDILSIILVMLFAADTTLTVSILSTFNERVESMNSFINEHMESLIGNVLDESSALNYRFYNVFDKMEESSKRLIGDRIEKTVSSMNGIYRSYLSRIKRFTGKNAERMNYVLNRIKNRVRKKENE